MHKRFIAAAIGCFSVICYAGPSHAEIGKRFPSEMTTMIDSVTGYPVNVLTRGPASNAKIYQTHPQWTSDGRYIIFRTGGRSPGAQAYAVSEATGEIIQVTDGPGNNTSTLNIARKSLKLYLLRNPTNETDAAAANAPATTGPSTAPARRNGGPTQIIEMDLARIFADSEAGAMKPAADYERVCVTLPTELRSGQLAIDADEKVAFIDVIGGDTGTHLPPGVAVQGTPEGARMGAGPAGLRSVNLETGEMKVIIDAPFKIGHVQSNPWVSGEIIYCHETGGDAPQRIWTVMADGSGNRPLYAETPYDWVTHEAVVTKDEVMFNLIGHQARLRLHPTGIAVINLRTNAMKILGQVDERVVEDPPANARPTTKPTGGTENAPATRPQRVGTGGFWHCNGSHDGRWAVGDTFNGNVWLIDRSDGKMTLLTTDHKMKPDHCHPTFDDTSSKILIQSGKLSDGKRLDLMVIPIPPELLNARK